LLVRGLGGKFSRVSELAAACLPRNREGLVGAEPLIVALIIGAIAGWLAGKIVRGAGFGLIGNIVVGIVGSLVATWLFPYLHIELGFGFFREVVNAAIGAIIVLVIISLIRRA
jgi:uncharacterized membrane protein YeaQ/YmgE (transglycosylase-associated protein family)